MNPKFKIIKVHKLTFPLISILVLILNCKQNKEAKIISVETANSQSHIETQQANVLNYTTATFTIKGMSCEMGCARSIENKLSKLESRVDNNEQVYLQTKNLQDSTNKNYNDIKKVLVNLKKDCHPLGYNVPECRPCEKEE